MPYEESLSALSDPTRRRVFESLRGGGLSVSQIARRMPVSRPAVSQHLKVLYAAGLVRARAAGTARIYTVRREGLVELRAYLDGFWDDVLDAYAQAANQQTGEADDSTGKEDD